MCIPRTPTSQGNKPKSHEDDALGYNLSSLQIPEVLERKVHETPPTLATNLESLQMTRTMRPRDGE